MSGHKSEHIARFHRSADSSVANGKSLGHIEEPNRFLLFPHIAPPDSASMDTNDVSAVDVKPLWTSSTIGGGGGGVTCLSPFREGRHENSPYRGQI